MTAPTNLALNLPTLLTEVSVWTLLAAQLVLVLLTLLFWLSTRRTLASFTPDPFRPSYRPGRMMRFLIRCGGVHPDDLADLGAGESLRHAITGSLMFIPAAMAFIGVNMWMSCFFPDAAVTRMVWSLIAAALIFGVDLACVSVLGSTKGKRAILAVLPRISMALVLGYFVCKPFVVAIYADEIQAMQRDAKKREILEVAQEASDHRDRFAKQNRPILTSFSEAKKDLKRRLETLAPRREQVQQRYDEMHRKYVKEVSEGQNGRLDGEGKYAKFFKAEMEKIREELDHLNQEELALKAEAAKITEDEERAVETALRDPTFAETNRAFDVLLSESRDAQATSVGRQLDLVRQYVAAGGPERKHQYHLWHVLFITIDTIPILMKLLMNKRLYLAKQQLAEQRIHSDIKAEADQGSGFAFEKARLRHEAELVRHRLGSLNDSLDMKLQAAAHLVIRQAQVAGEVRRTLESLQRSRMTNEEWEIVSYPLRQVGDAIREEFESVTALDPRTGAKRRDSWNPASN